MSTTPLHVVTQMDVGPIVNGTNQMAAAIKQASESMTEASGAATQAAESFAVMGQQAAEAGEKAGYSMTEARHAAHILFTEELGVHAPRAVLGFLSHMSFVGPALAAAFTPLAILALIDVLEKVPEHIQNSIDAMVGFGSAAKKAYEEAILENVKLQVEQLKLHKAMAEAALVGMHGSAEFAAKQKIAGDATRETAGLLHSMQEQVKRLEEENSAMSAKAAGGWAYVGTAILNTMNGSGAKMKENVKEIDAYQKAIAELQKSLVFEAPVEKTRLSHELHEAEIRDAEKAAKEQARITHERVIAELNDLERVAKEEARILHERARENAEFSKKVQEEIDKKDKEIARSMEESFRHASEVQKKELAEQARLAREQARPWLELEKQVNHAMDQMLVGVLRGTQTIGQAFSNLAGNIIMVMIEAFAKVLLAQLVYTMTAGAVGKEHAFGDIMRSAYQAAAKVYAEVPFPMNIPASAAVFAATAALGTSLPSAAGGLWQVPSDTLAMVHANETILPAREAAGLRSMVAGGGSGMTLNYAPQVHAMDARGVEAVLRQHSDTIASIMAQRAREFRG